MRGLFRTPPGPPFHKISSDVNCGYRPATAFLATELVVLKAVGLQRKLN